MTRQVRIALAGGIVALAAVLASGLDQPTARLMTGIDPFVARIFVVITWFGQGGVLLYPTGLAAVGLWAYRLWRPGRAAAIDCWIARVIVIFLPVAAAGLVNDALKIVFGRARPRFWLAGDMSGFDFFRYGFRYASFPSGHTATSVAAAVAFGVLFPRWRGVFRAGALLIAVSRVALDLHYVSDVIAGALVGAGTAIVVLGQLGRTKILARARRIRSGAA
jgi:membrane-associated phospholipid phosphatase